MGNASKSSKPNLCLLIATKHLFILTYGTKSTPVCPLLSPKTLRTCRLLSPFRPHQTGRQICKTETMRSASHNCGNRYRTESFWHKEKLQLQLAVRHSALHQQTTAIWSNHNPLKCHFFKMPASTRNHNKVGSIVFIVFCCWHMLACLQQ